MQSKLGIEASDSEGRQGSLQKKQYRYQNWRCLNPFFSNGVNLSSCVFVQNLDSTCLLMQSRLGNRIHEHNFSKCNETTVVGVDPDVNFLPRILILPVACKKLSSCDHMSISQCCNLQANAGGTKRFKKTLVEKFSVNQNFRVNQNLSFKLVESQDQNVKQDLDPDPPPCALFLFLSLALCALLRAIALHCISINIFKLLNCYSQSHLTAAPPLHGWITYIDCV